MLPTKRELLPTLFIPKQRKRPSETAPMVPCQPKPFDCFLMQVVSCHDFRTVEPVCVPLAAGATGASGSRE